MFREEKQGERACHPQGLEREKERGRQGARAKERTRAQHLQLYCTYVSQWLQPCSNEREREMKGETEIERKAARLVEDRERARVVR